MTNERPVHVQELPRALTQENADIFFEVVEPFLKANKPYLVFDFSKVARLDGAGVEVLLNCTQEVMKRNGDLKLAAVSPESAVILELTRVDRLFEIFETTSEAVESFYRFPVQVSQDPPFWQSASVAQPNAA